MKGIKEREKMRGAAAGEDTQAVVAGEVVEWAGVLVGSPWEVILTYYDHVPTCRERWF